MRSINQIQTKKSIQTNQNLKIKAQTASTQALTASFEQKQLQNQNQINNDKYQIKTKKLIFQKSSQSSQYYGNLQDAQNINKNLIKLSLQQQQKKKTQSNPLSQKQKKQQIKQKHNTTQSNSLNWSMTATIGFPKVSQKTLQNICLSTQFSKQFLCKIEKYQILQIKQFNQNFKKYFQKQRQEYLIDCYNENFIHYNFLYYTLQRRIYKDWVKIRYMRSTQTPIIQKIIKSIFFMNQNSQQNNQEQRLTQQRIQQMINILSTVKQTENEIQHQLKKLKQNLKLINEIIYEKRYHNKFYFQFNQYAKYHKGDIIFKGQIQIKFIQQYQLQSNNLSNNKIAEIDYHQQCKKIKTKIILKNDLKQDKDQKRLLLTYDYFKNGKRNQNIRNLCQMIKHFTQQIDCNIIIVLPCKYILNRMKKKLKTLNQIFQNLIVYFQDENLKSDKFKSIIFCAQNDQIIKLIDTFKSKCVIFAGIPYSQLNGDLCEKQKSIKLTKSLKQAQYFYYIQSANVINSVFNKFKELKKQCSLILIDQRFSKQNQNIWSKQLKKYIHFWDKYQQINTVHLFTQQLKKFFYNSLSRIKRIQKQQKKQRSQKLKQIKQSQDQQYKQQTKYIRQKKAFKQKGFTVKTVFSGDKRLFRTISYFINNKNQQQFLNVQRQIISEIYLNRQLYIDQIKSLIGQSQDGKSLQSDQLILNKYLENKIYLKGKYEPLFKAASKLYNKKFNIYQMDLLNKIIPDNQMIQDISLVGVNIDGLQNNYFFPFQQELSSKNLQKIQINQQKQYKKNQIDQNQILNNNQLNNMCPLYKFQKSKNNFENKNQKKILKNTLNQKNPFQFQSSSDCQEQQKKNNDEGNQNGKKKNTSNRQNKKKMYYSLSFSHNNRNPIPMNIYQIYYNSNNTKPISILIFYQTLIKSLNLFIFFIKFVKDIKNVFIKQILIPDKIKNSLKIFNLKLNY